MMSYYLLINHTKQSVEYIPYTSNDASDVTNRLIKMLKCGEWNVNDNIETLKKMMEEAQKADYKQGLKTYLVYDDMNKEDDEEEPMMERPRFELPKVRPPKELPTKTKK